MKLIKRYIQILCLMLTACNTTVPLITPTKVVSIPTVISPTTSPGLSPEAAKYLNDAFDIMENNSINKYKINWTELRTRYFNFAKNAQTPADTYWLIKSAVKSLNDNHSFFIPPIQSSSSGVATQIYTPPPEANLIQDMFGYVIVPEYGGSYQDQFGTDIQKQIQIIDQQHPCGWIVDLRGNGGGDMWPMLVGIGPILGEGIAGYFIDADGKKENWAYQDGKGLDNGHVISEVIGQPYYLEFPDPPVAILFDSRTLSSGEAIVVSFIGRPNTRSFGTNSGGLTTVNQGFPLSDGAWILLTNAIDADRTGKVYGQSIIPDVHVANIDQGAIPIEALQWLGIQSACK
jgi:carboxyl-terminal processing protease